MRESEAQRHGLSLLAADAPVRGTETSAAQTAAIAGGEREQSLPSGGGTMN
jgi:hypothetical protein